jgi:hypothetical protein
MPAPPIFTPALIDANGNILRVNPAFFSIKTGLFGDGSDGACVYDGTTTVAGVAPVAGVYTLTRPPSATTLRVMSAVTVKAIFPLYATTSIINDAGGVIDHSCGNAAGVVQSFTPTTGMYVASVGGVSAAFAAGAAGTGGFGFGCGLAGAGGLGSGGAGGTVGSAQTAVVHPYHAMLALYIGSIFYQGSTRLLGGSPGGGSGGGDGTVKGGAGAGSGGLVVLVSPIVTNNGTISANGGNGGTPPSGTNPGGGGGGGGGCIIPITFKTFWTPGTTSVLGGTGGAMLGTGVAGANGQNGSIVPVGI